MIVYVLFDKVSKQFTPTFEQPTKAAAVRALKKDAALMATVDDFLIFPLLSKFDMSDIGEVAIPKNFDWTSVLRFIEDIQPVELGKFLELEERDEK